MSTGSMGSESGQDGTASDGTASDGTAGDGRELARRCAEAMYAADRASRHLGIAIDEVAPGRASARMRVTDTMINGHDLCHGGYLVLLADTAFAFACNTYDRRTVAQGLDVTFLRPAHLGDTLVAVTTERSRTGRTGIYDVTVTREPTSEVVAEFRGRSRELTGSILTESIPTESIPTESTVTESIQTKSVQTESTVAESMVTESIVGRGGTDARPGSPPG